MNVYKPLTQVTGPSIALSIFRKKLANGFGESE